MGQASRKKIEDTAALWNISVHELEQEFGSVLKDSARFVEALYEHAETVSAIQDYASSIKYLRTFKGQRSWKPQHVRSATTIVQANRSSHSKPPSQDRAVQTLVNLRQSDTQATPLPARVSPSPAVASPSPDPASTRSMEATVAAESEVGLRRLYTTSIDNLRSVPSSPSPSRAKRIMQTERSSSTEFRAPIVPPGIVTTLSHLPTTNSMMRSRQDEIDVSERHLPRTHTAGGHNDAVSCLLNDINTVHGILNVFPRNKHYVTLYPVPVTADDEISSKEDFAWDDDSIVIAPLYEADGLVLTTFNLQTQRISYFNPRGNPCSSRLGDQLKTFTLNRFSGYGRAWSFPIISEICPSQDDHGDFDTTVLVICLHKLNDIPLPRSIRSNIWRPILESYVSTHPRLQPDPSKYGDSQAREQVRGSEQTHLQLAQSKNLPPMSIQDRPKQYLQDFFSCFDRWWRDYESSKEVSKTLSLLGETALAQSEQLHSDYGQQSKRKESLLEVQRLAEQNSLEDVITILGLIGSATDLKHSNSRQLVEVMPARIATIRKIEDQALRQTTYIKEVLCETAEALSVFQQNVALANIEREFQADKPRFQKCVDLDSDHTGFDVVAHWRRDHGIKLDNLYTEAKAIVDLCDSRDIRRNSACQQICQLIGPQRQYAKVGMLSVLTSTDHDALDVLYVTEEEALSILETSPARRLLLIRAGARQINAFDDFLKRLKHRSRVDVQDMWSDAGTKAVSKDASQVAQLMSTRNPALNASSQPLNLLNLGMDLSKYGMASSVLTQEANLSLAQTIEYRLDCAMSSREIAIPGRRAKSGLDHSTTSEESVTLHNDDLAAGKRTVKSTLLRDTSIEGCLRFLIAGQRGVFSGPHMDVLNGTYIKCLSGLKIWPIFDHDQLSPKDKRLFEKHGDAWLFPAGLARLIIIQPGETLFMPPGLKIIHAPITLEDCIMSGGMLWDYRTVLDTLKNLLYVAQHPQTTNEGIPTQLPDFLDMLEQLVVQRGEDFASAENRPDFEQEFRDVVRKLKQTCSCGHHIPPRKRKAECVGQCECDEFTNTWYCSHVCGCRVTFGQCTKWCK